MTYALYKPCIYHPALDQADTCWLTNHYKYYATAHRRGVNKEIIICESFPSVRTDHNILCIEPYYMPLDVKEGIVSVVLIGDFHHQLGLASGLAEYLFAMREKSTAVFFASSCQPWLRPLLEAATGCKGLKYLELSDDLLTLCKKFTSRKNPIRLQSEDTKEICITTSRFQPKRTIFLWNLYRESFHASRFHCWLSKKEWLALLLLDRGLYRVPTMAGQLSPQVTYPILLGRTVVTDIPGSALHLLGIPEMSVGKLFVPLTTKEMAIRPNKELSVGEAAMHYIEAHRKISDSCDFWVPGQSIYPSDSASFSSHGIPQTNTLWIFDILQVLLYNNYISNIKTTQRDKPNLGLDICLSALCSQVDTGIKGVSSIEVSINETFDEIEINDLNNMKASVISKDYSGSFIKGQITSHEAWRSLVWQRLNS
jgi:hypothetical protein